MNRQPKGMVAPFMDIGTNVGLCRINVPEDGKVWVELIRKASLTIEEARILADHMNGSTPDEVDEVPFDEYGRCVRHGRLDCPPCSPDEAGEPGIGWMIQRRYGSAAGPFFTRAEAEDRMTEGDSIFAVNQHGNVIDYGVQFGGRP